MINRNFETYFNDEMVRSHIMGNEESRSLLVLIPGMLYDIEYPPRHDILANVRNNLIDSSLSVITDKTRRAVDSNDRYETTINEQVTRIQNTLEMIKSDYEINKIVYLSHSMGSIVLRRLAQISDNNKDNKYVALVPPSPFISEISQILSCTNNFMPVIKDRSDNIKTTYASRDGYNFVMGNHIWDSLVDATKIQEYPNDTTYFVATNDRAFPSSCYDIYNKIPDKTIILQDSHSLKRKESGDIISKYIMNELLNDK